MKEIKLLSVWGEANDSYIPGKPEDGGNYFQPAGGTFWQVGKMCLVITLEETSCGDFGTRYDVGFGNPIKSYYMTWGSMCKEDEWKQAIHYVGKCAAYFHITEEAVWKMLYETVDAVRLVAYRDMKREATA